MRRIFLIRYFPDAVHFGSRRLADYTAKQLERITPLLRDMMGLMGLLMALFFCVNIYLLTVQAHSFTPHESARALISIEPWLIGGLLVGQAVTTFYYLRRFDSATESEKSRESTVD